MKTNFRESIHRKTLIGSCLIGCALLTGINLAQAGADMKEIIPAGSKEMVAPPAAGQSSVSQNLDTLVCFKGPNGAQPQSIIEDSAGHFYGTTLAGGTGNMGTVFEILSDGRLVSLVNFNGANGAEPQAGLLLGPDGSLYGSTRKGGASNDGTVFRISPDGKYSSLVTFNGKNGANPDSGLALGTDGNIYGATLLGGAQNKGTLFKFTPKGQFTSIASFDGSNGANPGSLVRADEGFFYGTCAKGGTSDKGTLFELATNGHITTLVTFNGSNGSEPVSGLIKGQGDVFYGATTNGGKDNLGTVFKYNRDGGLATVCAFNGANGSHPNSSLVMWSNGYFYMVRLYENMSVRTNGIQWSGNNFVGTTSGGGANGIGTIFRVGDNGDLMNLVSFSGTHGNDLGANPNSLVPGQDGNLYGTTAYGGCEGLGSVFRLPTQPLLPPIAGTGPGNANGTLPTGPSAPLSPPVVSN